MPRVLLVAPDQPGINQIPEIRLLTGNPRHSVTVYNGPVSARDVYEAARGRYDVIHFATHGDENSLSLSNGDLLTADDIARLGRQSKAQLVFFSSCHAQVLASAIVRRGIPLAVKTNIELLDSDAWKVPLAFYDAIADMDDIPRAFIHASDSNGSYGLEIDPQRLVEMSSLIKINPRVAVGSAVAIGFSVVALTLSVLMLAGVI
jgi:hypothetical protein